MSDSIAAQVIRQAIEIQQIPAPTFAEAQRAAWVYDQFQAEALKDVQLDSAGNVWGCIPGRGIAAPLVVSAHLDTVFPIHTPLNVRREPDRLYGPGIGDNALGVAGLFGLLWSLRGSPQKPGRRPTSSDLPGDIWLAANVAEEGLGNFKGMKGVVARFGRDVRAYLVLEGMLLGQIYHRALGVRRYRITARSDGGHSWGDYGRPSAIHQLAVLAAELIALPIPAAPRTTLNIGVISGGTSVNTIAAQASLELDLRSEDPRTLNQLAVTVDQRVHCASRPNAPISIELIGERPAGQIAERHPLVRLAQNCVEEQGLIPRLNIGSTDANIPLSMGIPAVCVGVSTGGGAHTTQEYIQLSPISQGIEHIGALAKQVWR